MVGEMLIDILKILILTALGISVIAVLLPFLALMVILMLLIVGIDYVLGDY